MKCPRCSSEKITCHDEAVDKAYCQDCGTLWTQWQQAEIEKQASDIASLSEELHIATDAGLDVAKLNEQYRTEIDRLKRGLKWQTGKPPKDGLYWVKFFSGEIDILKHRFGTNCFDSADGDDFWHIHPDLKWSGPLQPPSEEEGE